MSANPEQHQFQAEVSRLLEMMVHSVYSDRDIFLRELVSNGADACEKLRYEARSNDALMAGDAALGVTLRPDEAAGTLTVEDNGVGMDREELAGNLGTIARSGTQAFVEAMEAGEGASALIGQFGVGFYSAFMVAEKVTVVSRKAGGGEAWQWESDGKGTFEITAAGEDAPERGTRVTLHLKEDAKEFATPARLETVVRSHSAHVPVPIRLADGEVTREIADGCALWVKPKSEVDEEAYREFYQHVGGMFDAPALTVHYAAEGRQAYHVLLFVPEEKPFDLFDPERQGRVRFYVRRVFITDDSAVLPAYLRFVRGVVDSDDLPLNISREMLQESPLLAQIRKGVTNRILSEIGKLADKEPETLEKVWSTFGPVIKEGLYEDMERRDTLLDLVRFRSTTKSDGWRSLKDYIADMKDNQTAIYYVTAASHAQAAASPHLEGFRARGIEVLLLSDPVDHFWVRVAAGYEGKPFQSVTQGSADLKNIAVEGADEDDPDAPVESAVAALAAFIKQTLGDAVGEVRASDRLAESPVCLVASADAVDRRLERMLSRQEGAEVPSNVPDLELNPRHALIRHLVGVLGDYDKERLADGAWLLFDQAHVLDGDLPPDPAAFAARLSRMMAG